MGVVVYHSVDLLVWVSLTVYWVVGTGRSTETVVTFHSNQDNTEEGRFGSK